MIGHTRVLAACLADSKVRCVRTECQQLGIEQMQAALEAPAEPVFCHSLSIRLLEWLQYCVACSTHCNLNV